LYGYPSCKIAKVNVLPSENQNPILLIVYDNHLQLNVQKWQLLPDSEIDLLIIELNPETDSKALHCVYDRTVPIMELHGLSLFVVILSILWQNLSFVLFLQFMKKLVFLAYQQPPL
jgi:hypothetical protein